MAHKIVLLAGDGIGPEIMAVAKHAMADLEPYMTHRFEIEEALIGGAAIDQTQNPLPEETLRLAKGADAVLMGAVGGPQWEPLPRAKRPERGLLSIRAELGLFANLRPAILAPELVEASTLKPEVVAGLDLMIVRELTGGIYFGQPRGIQQNESGERMGYNTMVYHENEIRRIASIACEIAAKRNKKLCSVDKANVLEVSELWREIITEEVAKHPAGIELEHMYVDNAAMQLVRNPKQFDVMVTSNLFGDILSDCAAMLTGSIGMLPSASLNQAQCGLYEPVHGSAPDIAGQDKANPLALLLSMAMMLRYSLNEATAAKHIEKAVSQVLAQGFRTPDIAGPNTQRVGTKAMGDAICKQLKLIGDS